MYAHPQIHQLVQKFTADIAAFALAETRRVIEATNAEVTQALATATQAHVVAADPPVRFQPQKRAQPRAKGEKRPKTELAALRDRLAAYIAEHPGLRVEQLNKGLGLGANEAFLPLKHLIAAGTIATKGTRRATTYWPSPLKRLLEASATKGQATKSTVPSKDQARVERALTKAQSVAGAAELLKVSETTLRRTIAKLKISVKNYVQ